MGQQGEPALMPLKRRPLLERPFDASRECWTLTRDDGRGKIHVAYVPWWGNTACQHRLYIEPHRLVAEWMRFPVWGHMSYFQQHADDRANFCATCRSQVPSLPWEFLLPDGWTPPTNRDEAGVIADWWEERGELHRCEAIRSWIEKGGPPMPV